MSTDARNAATTGVGIPWVNPWGGVVRLWRHHPRWAGWFILGTFAIFTIFLAATIATTPPRVEGDLHLAGLGDIDLQREFGRRLLDGQWLYHHGLCYNYLPISALYWAPMAMVPPAVALIGRYLLSLWSIWFIFYALAKMLRRQKSTWRWDHVTCVALAFLLGLHFVLRDLTDGGAHLIYVAMMMGGVYCAWQGQEKLSATWFGLVIALKSTPGLFLPFLIWKRKWRLAAYTVLATVLWICLPAVFMGPAKWWQAQRAWVQMATTVFTDNFDDHNRSANELVPNNQAFKLMVLRYLTTSPPGSPLRLNDPADVQLLSLSEKTGNMAYYLSVLAILGGYAWWSRRPYTRADDPRWIVESAGVMLLALIFSPVIGMRHAVFAVPVLYLLMVHAQGFRRFDRLTWGLMVAYLAIEVLMNRAMLGKPVYLVLLSFRLHMVSFLLVLAMFLRARPLVAAGEPSLQPEPGLAKPAAAGRLELRGPHFGEKRQEARHG